MLKWDPFDVTRDNLNNDKFLKILTDKAKYIDSTEKIGQFFLRIKK